MVVGLDKIIDGEMIFALKQAGAPADDLLKLDHGVDRAHQDDIADIRGIHPSGELLRGGQDGGDGLFIILKGTEPAFPEGAFVGSHPDAIIWVGTVALLIDQISYDKGMRLGGAEDQGLFLRTNHLHEQAHPIRFPRPDLDTLVEVRFRVASPFLNFPGQHLIIRGVDIVVQGGGDLADPKRGKETVVDALPQRVGVHRLAEIGIGVLVLCPFGRGGQAQLHCRGKIFQDIPPAAFVIGTAPMALINHNEIEEVGRVFAKTGQGLALLIPAAHKGLEDSEKDAAVSGNAAFFADAGRVDADQSVLGKGGKGVEGLIGQDIAISEKEDAGAASGLVGCLSIPEVPAAVEELPGQLKGDAGFAGARGQGQEDAILAGGDGLQHTIDGVMLVIASLPAAASVFKGDCAEAIPPEVGLLEGGIPELFRAWKGGNMLLLAGLHVDPVDTQAVGGKGETGLEAGCVALGLAHALGVREAAALGLNHGQFMAFVDEDVIGDLGFAAFVTAEDAARSNDLPPDSAAFDFAPASLGQGRVDQLCSGFRFVHGVLSLVFL